MPLIQESGLAARLASVSPALEGDNRVRAESLVEFHGRRGGWTPAQAAFARRLISQAERAASGPFPIAEAATPAPVALGADLSRIHALFATATANGLQRPRLTVGSVTLTPSRSNPEALNVRAEGGYAGTVVGGIFRPRGAVNEAVAGRLRDLAADPSRALTAHGHATGRCGICSRPLSDPVSVAMGIGPICAGRFGLSREGVTPAATSVTIGDGMPAMPLRAPRVRRPTVPPAAQEIAALRASQLARQAANVRNRYQPAGGRAFGDDEIVTEV